MSDKEEAALDRERQVFEDATELYFKLATAIADHRWEGDIHKMPTADHSATIALVAHMYGVDPDEFLDHMTMMTMVNKLDDEKPSPIDLPHELEEISKLLGIPKSMLGSYGTSVGGWLPEEDDDDE